MNRRHYTIIEVLFICAVLLCVLSVVTRQAYLAMLYSRQFSTEAVATEQMELVRRAWQPWLAATDPSAWHLDGTTLTAGDRSLALTDNRLVFTSPQRVHPVTLPAKAGVEYDLHPADRYAVITITWPAPFGSRRDLHSVRLVAACPATENAP